MPACWKGKSVSRRTAVASARLAALCGLSLLSVMGAAASADPAPRRYVVRLFDSVADPDSVAASHARRFSSSARHWTSSRAANGLTARK